MKANELMIGDWVRMRRIDVENATYYTSKVLCLAKDGFLEYEPIPLTEDILKANGFIETRHGFEYKEKLSSFGDTFIVNTAGMSGVSVNGFEEPIILACYVHELQHALRLCGLNDLADNFKIQKD